MHMLVRIAQQQDMSEVYKITHDVYVSEGYCEPQLDGMLRHYSHIDNIPETIVFIVEDNGKIIGTNSLTFDGPKKFNVDEDFGDIVEQIRQENRKVAASWRIVTTDGRTVILKLISATVEKCRDEHVDILLCSLNPKHARFYERILGMRVIAEKYCRAVNAPAVLMRGDAEQVFPAWDKFNKEGIR